MIYYVEDDRNIRDLLIYALRQTGFEAQGFSDSPEFFAAMSSALPELILLDVMLPGEDGISILQKLKSNPATMALPVIMLTARGAEYDKVLGLDTGADDYVTKPFAVMELIARIKAVLRRCKTQPQEPVLSVGRITINHERHTVTADEKEIALTFKEYSLLRFLMENAGKAFDRDTLLNEVWSIDYFGGTRTVDVHIQTLRQKLGACGDQIETIRGLGYRIAGGERK